jgi:AraC-like DNA-binding protein
MVYFRGTIQLYNEPVMSKYTLLDKPVGFADLRINYINNFNADEIVNSASTKWYTLIFVKSGSGIIKIDFEELITIKNKIFLIDKYKKFTWSKNGIVDGIMIQFTDSLYNQIYTGNPKIKSDQTLSGAYPPFIKIEREEEAEWSNLIEVILNEYTRQFENSREVICLCLKALIVLYRRKANLSNSLFIADRKRKLMDDFIRMLNRRFTELKTPKEFAQILNISPNYLNAVCKAISNKTVSYCIQERVILEAKRFLTHTELTVSEISFKLGFKDNSYFGRYFRKAVGMSPERFRIANNKGNGRFTI